MGVEGGAAGRLKGKYVCYSKVSAKQCMQLIGL
jgi:hypothetical protein